MKKLFALITFFSFAIGTQAQDIFNTGTAKCVITSSTALESFTGTSTTSSIALNIKTGAIYSKVTITSLKFERELMQEHFNENYMESDKYPTATFKAAIDKLPSLTTNGTYNVTVTGQLTIHGVMKTRTIPATITVSAGKIHVHCSFTVKPGDHNIAIPSVVAGKIASDIPVSIDADLTLYKE